MRPAEICGCSTKPFFSKFISTLRIVAGLTFSTTSFARMFEATGMAEFTKFLTKLLKTERSLLVNS